MKQKIYDIVIIGAGPAGSAAAITIAKKGHSVLLIDKFSFPREKICGDGLTGDSLNMLKELGVWSKIEPTAYRSSKVELFPNRNKSFILESPVYTVKREHLDKILLDHAVFCGAEFRQLNFKGEIEQKKNYIFLKTEDNNLQTVKITAKFGLFSTGCQFSKSLKKFNLARPDLIAVRGYYKANWNIKHPLVFLSNDLRNGYFWIFPMGNNEFNIGYGTNSYQKIDLKNKLYEFISHKIPFKDISGYWASPVKGSFLRTNLSNTGKGVSKNILFAGEVLGSTLPFTGEGIGKALETGIIAGETVYQALLKNDTSILTKYNERIKNELQIKYRPYRIASFFCKYKMLNKIFFALLIRSNKLCYITSQILNDKVNKKHLSYKDIICYMFKMLFKQK